MASSLPLFINESDLSRAWAKAFCELTKPGVKEITPLVVSVTGFIDSQPVQDQRIQDQLDLVLSRQGKYSTSTVASTLFPYSMWNPAAGRMQLFQRYLQLLPTIRRTTTQNRYGLYFERLIAYGSERMNQLEHVIRTYRSGNHRRSALQASIFLPSSDHTNQPRRGFPCMQHVAFTPCNDGELAITGFYASQYIFERAYGNYVGLCNLGQFMAHEMDLKLTRMTCIASVGLLGTTKRNVRELAEFVSTLVD